MTGRAQSLGHNRRTVRPTCRRSSAWPVQARQPLANALRLRDSYPSATLPRPERSHTKLRLPPSRNCQPGKIQARTEQRRRSAARNSPLSHLGKHEAAMLKSESDKLPPIRRARHFGLCRVAGRFSILRKMGARQWLPAAPYNRTSRQRRGLYTRQLPLGDVQRASGKQKAAQCLRTRIAL